MSKWNHANVEGNHTARQGKHSARNHASHADTSVLRHTKSLWFKCLCVVMAILLAFLLVPQGAMSVVRSYAEEAASAVNANTEATQTDDTATAGDEQTSDKTATDTEQQASDKTSDTQQTGNESLTDASNDTTNSDTNANDANDANSNSVARVYYDAAQGKYVEAQYNLNDPEQNAAYLNANDVDYNFTYDYSEYKDQGKLYPTQNSPITSYNPDMDISYYGYLHNYTENETAIEYVATPTTYQPNGFVCNFGSQTSAYGSYIAITPHETISNFLINMRVPSVKTGKTATFYLSKDVLSTDTDRVVFKNTFENSYESIDLEISDKTLEAGHTYFLFTNADSTSAADIATGGVIYSGFKACSNSESGKYRAITGEIPKTSTAVEATVKVTAGSETYTDVVTTSTYKTTRFAVEDIRYEGVSVILDVMAEGYTTYTKEQVDISTKSQDIGLIDFKMADISISGTISNGDENYPTYGFFTYTKDDGTLETQTEQVTVETSGAFTFTKVVADKEGVFSLAQYNELTGVYFNSYSAYMQATIKPITGLSITLEEQADNYTLTYDTTAFSTYGIFPVLGDTEGNTHDYKIASGFQLSSKLGLFFITKGQYDKIRIKDTEIIVTGTHESPYYLEDNTELELAYPSYDWSPNETTVIPQDLSTRVTCTGKQIVYKESGASYEVEQTVVATPRITKSSTTEEQGEVEYTATFTKTDESGKAVFESQKKTYPLALDSTHKHDDVEFYAWDSDDSLPTVGNYYLTSDVTVSRATTISYGAVNLCLNGHQVTTYYGASSYSSSIYEVTGGKLSIYDCKAGSSANRHYFNVGSNLLWTPTTDVTSNYYDGGCIVGAGKCAIWHTGGEVFIHGGGFIGNSTATTGDGPSQRGRGGAICTYTANGSSSLRTHIVGSELADSHSSFDSKKSVNFVGNLAYFCGGAVYYQNVPPNDGAESWSGSFTCSNAQFYGNVAGTHKSGHDAGGGALWIENGYDPTFESTNFYNNYSYGKGGAVFARGIRHDYLEYPDYGKYYHYGIVKFTNCNMMYNACDTLDGETSAGANKPWGGGIGLSTDFGTDLREVNDIEFAGTCLFTENLNYSRVSETTGLFESDNVCMERHYKTFPSGYGIIDKHSRVIFDDTGSVPFNYTDSRIGVNTLTWGNQVTPYSAMVTNNLSTDHTLDALHCMTEDTVLDSSGYTIAYRTMNDPLSEEHSGEGQIYLLPHVHTVQGEITYSHKQGVNDTLKIKCGESSEYGFNYYMSTLDPMYDPDFAYNDYYKCKYSKEDLKMVSEVSDCVYDGKEHGTELTNLTEMIQQGFVLQSYKTTYYLVEGEKSKKIEGVPVNAGTYRAITTITYRNDHVEEGEIVTEWVEDGLTSVDYTISPRPVNATLVGQERPFNGTGVIKEFATSYLDKTSDKESGVVSKDGVYDNVFVVAGDNAQAGLQTLQDFNNHEIDYSEDATNTTAGETSNPMATEQTYYSDFDLGGTAANNYIIKNFDGYCKINPITQTPHVKDIYLGLSELTKTRYINWTTSNWLDRGDGDLGTWYPIYYYGGTDPETGDPVPAIFPWLTFKYYNPDTREVSDTDPTGQTVLTQVGDPAVKSDDAGFRITANTINEDPVTHLQLCWEGRDVNGDGFPEYSAGEKPSVSTTDGDGQSNDQDFITVYITDFDTPALKYEMTAEVDGKALAEGDTVYVGQTIDYTMKAQNVGYANTIHPTRLYNDAANEGQSPQIYTEELKAEGGQTPEYTMSHTVTEADLEASTIKATGQAKTQFESETSPSRDIESNTVVITNKVEKQKTVVDVSSADRIYNGQPQSGLSQAIDPEIIEGGQLPEAATATDVKYDDAGKITSYTFSITLKDGYVWKEGASTEDPQTKVFTWIMKPREVTVNPTAYSTNYDGNTHNLSVLSSVYDGKECISTNQDAKSLYIANCDDVISVTDDSFAAEDAIKHVQTKDVYLKAVAATRDEEGTSKDVAGNYKFTYGSAELRINPTTIDITVKGAERTTTYNTQEQTAWGATAESESEFFDKTKLNIWDSSTFESGETIGFSKFIAGKGTDVGIYIEDHPAGTITYDGTVIEGGIRYQDFNGNVTYVDGKLTIDSKPMDDPETSTTGYITVTGTNKVYNGVAQTQDATDVTVNFHWKNLMADGTTAEGDTTLTSDDFTLTADSNSEVGSEYKVTATAVTPTEPAKAKFINSKTAYWEITKASASIITSADPSTIKYDGQKHSLTATGKDLVNEQTINVLTWQNEAGEAVDNSIEDVGTLTIKPLDFEILSKDGKLINPNNYNLAIEYGSLTIEKASIEDTSVWAVSDASTVYNGQVQSAFKCDTPVKVVGKTGTFKDVELTLNRDFTAVDTEYKKTDVKITDGQVAAYQFTITGYGNFEGTRTVNYTINKAKLTLQLNNYYTGTVSEETYTVTFNNKTSAESVGGKYITYTKNSETGKYDVPQEYEMLNSQTITATFHTTDSDGTDKKDPGHYVESGREGSYTGLVASSLAIKSGDTEVSNTNYEVVPTLDIYLQSGANLAIKINGKQASNMYDGTTHSVTVKQDGTAAEGEDVAGWSAKITSGQAVELGSYLVYKSDSKTASATNVGDTSATTKVEMTGGQATVTQGQENVLTIGDFQITIAAEYTSAISQVVITSDDPATQTITARPVSVTPGTADSSTKSKIYDGDPLSFTNDEFVTGQVEEKGGLLTGDYIHTAAVSKWLNNSQTNAGKNEKVTVDSTGFTITGKDAAHTEDTNLTSNYAVTYNKGTLNVEKRKLPDPVPGTETGQFVVSATSYTYNGVQRDSNYTVKGYLKASQEQATTLTLGDDFTLTGDSVVQATNASSYIIHVVGAGNYDGDIQTTWTISKRPIDVSGEPVDVVYDGAGHTISKVTYNTSTTEEKGLVNSHQITSTFTAEEGPDPRTDVTDDDGVIYTPNEVTITDQSKKDVTNNYAINKVDTTLKITPVNISDTTNFTVDASSPYYSGEEQATTTTVTSIETRPISYETTLKLGRDYSITKGGTAKDYNANKYTVEIKGEGNFTGTRTATWNIQQIEAYVRPVNETYTYDGIEHQLSKVTFAHKDPSSQKTVDGLVNGESDVEGAYDVTWSDNNTATRKTQDGIYVKSVDKIYLSGQQKGGTTTPTTNYTWKSNTGTITINPFDLETADVKVGKIEKPYTSDEQTLSKAEVANAGVNVYEKGTSKLLFTLTEADFNLIVSPVIHAGSYPLTINGSEAFSGSVVCEKAWSITKVALTVTPTDVTKTYDWASHSIKEATYTGLQTNDTVDFDSFTWSPENARTNAGTTNTTPAGGYFTNSADKITYELSHDYNVNYEVGTIQIDQRDITGEDWVATPGVTTYNGTQQDAFNLTYNYEKTCADEQGTTKQIKAQSASLDFVETPKLKAYKLVRDQDFDIDTGEADATDVSLDASGKVVARTFSITGKGNFTGTRQNMSWTMYKAWAKMYGQTYALYDNDKAAEIKYTNSSAEDCNMYFETQAGVNKLVENQQFKTTLTTGVYDASGNFTAEGKYYQAQGSEVKELGCYYLPDSWTPAETYHKMGTIRNAYSITTQTSDADVAFNYDIDYTPYIQMEGVVTKVCTKISISPDKAITIQVHANSKRNNYTGKAFSETLPTDTDFDNYVKSDQTMHGNYIYLPEGETTDSANIWLEVTHPAITAFDITQFAWKTGGETERKTKAISVVPTEGETQSIALENNFAYNKSSSESELEVNITYGETSKNFTHTINAVDATVTPDINKGSGELSSTKQKVYDGTELKFTNDEIRADGLMGTNTQKYVVSLWANNSQTDAGSTETVKVANGAVMGTDDAHTSEADLTTNYNVNYATGTLKVTQRDIGSDPTFSLSATSCDYTGKSFTTVLSAQGTLIEGQDPTVLIEGKDYRVSKDAQYTYTAVDNSGTAKGYEVHITGDGNYTGELSAHWQIRPIKLEVKVDDQTYTYDGQTYTGQTTSKGLVNGESLSNITYKQISSTPEIEGVSITDAGSLTLGFDTDEQGYKFDILKADKATVVPQCNYTIQATQGTITIKPRSLKEASFKMTATGSDYTGSLQDATIQVVYDNGKTKYTLVKDQDYDLNDKKVNKAKDYNKDGNYTAGVTGKKNFTDDLDAEWNINPVKATLTLTDKTETYNGLAHSLSELTTQGLKANEVVKFADVATSTNSLIDAGDLTVNATAVNAMYQEDGTTPTPVTNYTWELKSGKLTVTPLSIEGGDWNVVEGITTYNGTQQNAFNLTSDYLDPCSDSSGTKKEIKAQSTSVTYTKEGQLKGHVLKETEDFFVKAGESKATNVAFDDEGKVAAREVTIQGKGNYTGNRTVKWTMNKAWAKLYGDAYKLYDDGKAITINWSNKDGESNNMYFETQAGVNSLVAGQTFATTMSTGRYDGETWVPEGNYYTDPTTQAESLGSYYLPEEYPQSSEYHKMGTLKNDYRITDTGSNDVKANYDISYDSYIKQDQKVTHVCTRINISPSDSIYVIVHANSVEDTYDGNAHSVTLPADTDFDNFYNAGATGGSYVFLPKGVKEAEDAPIWLEVIHPLIDEFDISQFTWKDGEGATAKSTNAISVEPEEGSTEVQAIDLVKWDASSETYTSKFEYTPTSGESLLKSQVYTSLLNLQFTHTIAQRNLTVVPDENKGTGVIQSDKTQVYNGKEFKFADDEIAVQGIAPDHTSEQAITDLQWTNNSITNVGQQAVNISDCKVTGKDVAHTTSDADLTGNYKISLGSGSLTVTQKDITTDNDFVLAASSFNYDEASHTTVLTLTGKLAGEAVTLVEGNDFEKVTTSEYTYTARDNSDTTTGYSVRAKGIKNFTGTKDTTWEINPVALTVKVDDQPSITYDMQPHSGTSTPTGLVNQQSLGEVTYEQVSSSPQIEGVSITDVGTLTLKIKDFDILSSDQSYKVKHCNYTITLQQGTLTVVPRSISGDDFAMVAYGSNYTGATQDATIYAAYIGPEGERTYIELVEGRDYKRTTTTEDPTVTNSAKDVKTDGNYTAGITGINNLTGTRTYEWNITPIAAYLGLNNATYVYDKTAHYLKSHWTSGLASGEYVEFNDIKSGDQYVKDIGATIVNDSKTITPDGVAQMYTAAGDLTPTTNYTWSYYSGDLTITKRPVSVNVNGKNDTVEYDAQEHQVPNSSQGGVGYYFASPDPAEETFVTEADPKLKDSVAAETYVVKGTNVNRDASGNVIPYSKAIVTTDFDYTNKDNIELTFNAGSDEWLLINPRKSGKFTFSINEHDKYMYDSGYNVYGEAMAHFYEIKEDAVTVVDTTLGTGFTLNSDEYVVTGEKKEAMAYSDDPYHDGVQQKNGRVYTVGAMGAGKNYEAIEFTDASGAKVTADWEVYKRDIADTWEDYTYYSYEKLYRYDGQPHSLGVAFVGKHTDGEVYESNGLLASNSSAASTASNASNDEDPFTQLVTVDQSYEVNIGTEAYTEPGWYVTKANAITDSNYQGTQDLYWAIVGDDVEGFGDITWDVEVSDAKYEGTSVAQSKADIVKSTGDANKLGRLIEYTQAGVPDNSLDIRMYVDDATESMEQQPETRSMFESQYGAAGESLYQYLDINIWNKLTLMREDPEGSGQYRPVTWDEDLTVWPTHVTELNEPGDTITTTLPVPADLQEKVAGQCEYISVYRYHDGTVEKLETVADNDAKTITFNSDKFSEFALAYTPVEDGGDVSPTGTGSTGDNTMGAALAGIAALGAMCAVVAVVRRRRYDR